MTELTDLERIARFRTVGYGGAVADALKGFGVVNTLLSREFRPVRPGMLLVGRAIPVRVGPRGTPPAETDDVLLLQGRQRVDEHEDVPQREVMRAVQAAEEGSVVCYTCAGDDSEAHFGELSATLAHAHGCRGVLMHGNLRDVSRIVRLPDFPAFTTGTCANAYGVTEIISVNEPTALPGRHTPYVYVNPGDFVFGDDDGVMVIPAGVVDETLEKLEALTSREARERELISAGMPIDDVYKTIGIL
jgi:4-hydroxy-4-methyl-2-oxoglutarate aldolase